MSEELLHSPLEPIHQALKARLVPFAGWNMPVAYESIIAEHNAVREDVGIFDISHMGQLMVRGADAMTWLNAMLTNDVAKLAIDQGHYTFLLNPRGGVIDDLLVYRIRDTEYLLVVNASKTTEDYNWLKDYLSGAVELQNASLEWAGMAVQGPRSKELFDTLFPQLELPKRNHLRHLAGGGWLCRTGYTGEDGFEYFCPAAEGSEIFQKFLDAGATACGLGARDSLRLEMCYPLNGNDLSPTRTPLEAGLGFFVALDKGEFCGREALIRQREEGYPETLTAMEYLDKGAPPRAGYAVLNEDQQQVGQLTSGGLSPTLGKGIALGYIPKQLARPGTRLAIQVRNRTFPVEVVKKPFYRNHQK